MNTNSYDVNASFFFFLAFLRYKINQDRAKQINIARSIGVRPEYINRVYKGRQTCSVDVQEKICRFFGISYLEALAIGSQLVQTGEIPSSKNTQPDNALPPFVEKNSRRAADRVSEEDLVSIVAQWVSKKKETEETLAKLRNIIENLSEGVVILDTNLIIEYQNRSHREMFGSSLIGQVCYTAHGCEKSVRDYPGLVARRTGMAASGFFPYAKGTVSAVTTPVRNMSGQITGYVEVLRDITEMEKKLLMAEEFLEMIDRAVFVCDENHKIRLFNSKLKEITGAGDKDLTTIETFLSYLHENRIFVNFDEVAELVGKANKDIKDASLKVSFSNGKTYIYSARQMYTQEKYIGIIGFFVPAD